jgi:chitin synthase
MKTITKQKHILLLCLIILNVLLSALVIIYDKYWYIFIIILASGSAINSINTILLIYIKLYKWIKNCTISDNENIYILNGIENTNTNTNANAITNKNTNEKFIYVLPCYNETENELNNTINSILEQSNVENYNKLLVVICDGKINSESGKGLRTDKILTNIIFKDYIKEKVEYEKAYKTWNYDYKNNIDEWNNLEIHLGKIKGLKFIIIIKPVNLGKRDSLTLIRRICNYYNNSINITENIFNLNIYLQYLSSDLLIFIDIIFNKIFKKQKISYIIGTDADTILDTNCTSELISSIIKNKNYNTTDYNTTDYNTTKTNTESIIVGVVGFVDVVKSWNPLVLYQYCEYLYAQCLRRRVQSIITKKVNCLSGCVQLIRVCKETCGNEILDAFNRLPKENEHIFNHIRSYASEDRNHICLMFSMFPYVETIQNIKAIAYTNVPDTLIKFIRQMQICLLYVMEKKIQHYRITVLITMGLIEPVN